LIEVKVYRFHPHTSDDDDRSYRSPDEVKAWKEQDAVRLFERRLLEVGALTDEQLQVIQSEIREEVDEATDAAEKASQPDPATFDRYVYAES
jgi:2-oxoisovalerate dehydrogenase E1 component alpha subunit